MRALWEPFTRANMTIAVVVALAGVAEAAPVALLDVDVDDDGTADHVELDSDGTLRIGGIAKASVKLTGAVTRGKLAAAHAGGKPVIVVEHGTEAVVFVLDRTWRELLRFPIGGVGLDGDYGVAVDTSPSWVMRYQTVPGARRCDGRPAHLFAESLDATTKRFTAVKPPILIERTAQVLVAKLDQQPPVAPLVYRARLASHQPGAGDAGGLTIPAELDDGRLDTAWRESLGGDGKGHFFTFETRVTTALARQIRIVPGNPTSVAALQVTNRPQRIGIVTATGSWWIDIPDATKDPIGAAYVADLPTPIAGCVTIILESTFAGASDVTAIAELGVYAEGERAGGGEAMLARLVAEGNDGAISATAALAKRGALGVVAIDAELAKTTDVVVRRRLIKALATFRDPTAAGSLVKAATDGWVRGTDLLDVIEALGTFGQTRALAMLANSDVELEARVAAASRIRPNDKAGLSALVELAGKGPRELRRAVIDALAAAPIANLLDGIQAGASGDVWRAITKQARTTPDVEARTRALAAMIAALPSAPDYERRYRLIDGIATLGDTVVLRQLAQILLALPVSSESSALRQVAIRAVAASPRMEAMPLVIGLARDADPGVRMATIGVLATADGEPGGTWHAPDGPDSIDRVIVTALSTDTWPEVRRRAAESLGDRCVRVGPATALTHSIAKDRDPGVRVGALTALVQCKATNVATLLARLWDDGSAPLELRAHAVDLAVTLGDVTLGAKLVGKLGAWRGAALESKEALVLAQRAATSIGRLAPLGAAQALMAALDDSAFPEIVSAAAIALGALGPACPANAKAKLVQLARDDEALAVAAKRAAAQCGRAL